MSTGFSNNTVLPLAVSAPQACVLMDACGAVDSNAERPIGIVLARGGLCRGLGSGSNPVAYLGETGDRLGVALRALSPPDSLHLVSSHGCNAVTVMADGTTDIPHRLTMRDLWVYGGVQAERFDNLVGSFTSTNPFMPPSAAALGSAYRTLSNMIVRASFAAGGISNIALDGGACNLVAQFLTTAPDQEADVEVNSISTGTIRVAEAGYVDAHRYLNLAIDHKSSAAMDVPASAYALHAAFAELSNISFRSNALEWRNGAGDLLASLDPQTGLFAATGGYGNLPIVSSFAQISSNDAASIALLKAVRDQSASVAAVTLAKADFASNAVGGVAALPVVNTTHLTVSASASSSSTTASFSLSNDALVLRDARLVFEEGYAGLVHDVLPSTDSNAPPSAAGVGALLRRQEDRVAFASNLSAPLDMLVATAPARAAQGIWSSNVARWASNAAGCLSNWTGPRSIYASNAGMFGSNAGAWASNQVVATGPALRWSSNAAHFASNAARWGSNLSAQASNLSAQLAWTSNEAAISRAVAEHASNAAVSNAALSSLGSRLAWTSNAAATGFEIASFASNIAGRYSSDGGVWSSNELVLRTAPQSTWASNAVGWASNLRLPQVSAAADWASDAARWGCNAAVWASNESTGLRQQAQTAAQWASNAAGWASNARLPQVGATAASGSNAGAWASNAGRWASNAAAWASNALGPVDLAADWASNEAARARAGSSAAVWASNEAVAAGAAADRAHLVASNAYATAVMATVDASNLAAATDNTLLKAVWGSNAARWSSNWVLLHGMWTSNTTWFNLSNVYGTAPVLEATSNHAFFTSNHLFVATIPTLFWTSNLAASNARLLVFNSNAAGTALSTATWACNAAVLNSASLSFGSNAARWASNAVASFGSASAVAYASNAASAAVAVAASDSNVTRWLSNEIGWIMHSPVGVVQSSAWASNAAAAALSDAAGAASLATAASNSAAVAARALALTAESNERAMQVAVDSRANASNAFLAAEWSSNAVALCSNAAVWGSNAAVWGSNAADQAVRTALDAAASAASAVEVGLAAASNSAAATEAAIGATEAAQWASNAATSALATSTQALAASFEAAADASAAESAAAAALAAARTAEEASGWLCNAVVATSNEAFALSYERSTDLMLASETPIVSGTHLDPDGQLSLQLSNAPKGQSALVFLDGAAEAGGLLTRGGADAVLSAGDGAVVRISGTSVSGLGALYNNSLNTPLPYPPAPGADAGAGAGAGERFTMCNVLYGEGVDYAATASTSAQGHEARRAFSYANSTGSDPLGPSWTSELGYSTSSGFPNVPLDQRDGEGVPRTTVDGVPRSGDWLQLNLPESESVYPPRSYTIAPRLAFPLAGSPDGQPRRWVLAGSSDGGATWTTLDASYATVDYAPANAYIEVVCPPTTSAAVSRAPLNAFRLIVLRVSVSEASTASALFVAAEVCALRVNAAPTLATLSLNSRQALLTGALGIGAPLARQQLDVEGSAIVSSNLGLGGTRYPQHALELGRDDAVKPASGLWTVFSDARLKSSIEDVDLQRCYDIVKSVPLRRYSWRDEVYDPSQVADRARLGWIAQEVAPAFPKAVSRAPAHGLPDCMSLNSDQLVAALYGAVQRLMQMVETGGS